MRDVLWNLEYALQLQEASSENSANHIPQILGWIPQVESINADRFDVITDQASDANTTTSDVFSQLMNPKGRQFYKGVVLICWILMCFFMQFLQAMKITNLVS